MAKTFTLRVLDIVRAIPKGQTLSYGQVAALAGSPKAARAVGLVMAKNFDINIPCHRVIKSDGSAGGYNRGSIQKVKLLASEKA